ARDLVRKSWRKRGMKATFHYDAGPRVKARFTTFAAEGFKVEACPEADEARLAAHLPEAEVWLHVLKPITAGLIERAPRLRLIQKIGVGVNTIDLDAARPAASRSATCLARTRQPLPKPRRCRCWRRCATWPGSIVRPALPRAGPSA